MCTKVAKPNGQFHLQDDDTAEFIGTYGCPTNLNIRSWLGVLLYSIDRCVMDKILKNFERVKFITTALTSILNVVKLQSLVVKCCKI